MKLFKIAIKYISLVFIASFPIVSPASQTVDKEIESTLTKIQAGTSLIVDGIEQRFLKLLPDFYQRRQYQPAWIDQRKIIALIESIGNAPQHGLLAQHYHYETLKFLQQKTAKSNSQIALLDLIATDAMILFTKHLLHGKVHPEHLYPRWNLTRTVENLNLLAAINITIEQESIREWFDRMQPDFPIYRRMKTALNKYKVLAESPGWRIFPTGRLLKRGMRDNRTPVLRHRLRITDGSVATYSSKPELYDAQLEKSVRIFQRRHGLNVDGIVGPNTRAALNTPLAQRIDQLRVNLERARWVLHNIHDRTVVVNIAGYSLYIADGKIVEWKTRVVVGRSYRKTPVFKSKISHVILNPSWTVPPTIFAKDILPKAIDHPESIQQHGLKVVDSRGNIIDPTTLDWKIYKTAPFPYRLRQDPGSNNALGRIKFMFPNPYTVFMHDTPNRELFEKPKRTFSSGCIRVDKPFELAVHLFDNPEAWSKQHLVELVETGQTKTIPLPKPVEILVMYWTAGVDFRGVVHFRNDVYKRDPAVLSALNKPFIAESSPNRRHP